MRKRLSTDRPDWPRFMVRNIPPDLWDQAKARALAESHDGSPRLNHIFLELLRLYVARGLASLDPSVNPTSSPTSNPGTSPTPGPHGPVSEHFMRHHYGASGATVSPSTDPSVSPSVNPRVRYKDGIGQYRCNRCLHLWQECRCHLGISPSADPTVSPDTSDKE